MWVIYNRASSSNIVDGTALAGVELDCRFLPSSSARKNGSESVAKMPIPYTSSPRVYYASITRRVYVNATSIPSLATRTTYPYLLLLLRNFEIWNRSSSGVKYAPDTKVMAETSACKSRVAKVGLSISAFKLSKFLLDQPVHSGRLCIQL
jgi:hypothetical protein